MRQDNFILILFFLVGISLIGVGANGMVVSDSCCFPPFCNPTNTCDLINTGSLPNTNQLTLYMGMTIFISSLVAYSLINKK